MPARVVVSSEAGVADVRLSRPDKLNALDGAMFEELIEAGRSLARDPSLRAVVLSGEGRAFCAGLDFPSFQAGGTAVDLFARNAESPANVAQRAPWIWTELPVPVIAAVHGYAFGGGLQLALGADLRIVTPDVQLSVMEIRWGLVPDMAGTPVLERKRSLNVLPARRLAGKAHPLPRQPRPRGRAPLRVWERGAVVLPVGPLHSACVLAALSGHDG